MMAAHIGLHIPVPSVSGQAVLTMPIMAPWPTCWECLTGLRYWPSVTAPACRTWSRRPMAVMAVLAAAGVATTTGCDLPGH